MLRRIIKSWPLTESTATSAHQPYACFHVNQHWKQDSVLFLNILSKEAAWYVFVKDGCHPNSVILFLINDNRLWSQIHLGFKSRLSVWFGENPLASVKLTVSTRKMRITKKNCLNNNRLFWGMSVIAYVKHKCSKMLAALLLLLLCWIYHIHPSLLLMKHLFNTFCVLEKLSKYCKMGFLVTQ